MPSRRHRYYALVASLPALPKIRAAERLPINGPRLDERLRMLYEDDAAVVERLRTFVRWEDESPGQADADVAARYRDLLAGTPQGAVRTAIGFRIDLRTVLAALRRRHRGEGGPPSDPDWGLGRWVRHIEANWGHPDFKLAHVFPWVLEAREHLENGDAVALEELVMGLGWDALDRLAFGKYFELETVIAFVFKWEVLRGWLSYKEELARERFEALATTIINRDGTTTAETATTTASSSSP